MKRRVVQIAATPETANVSDILYALADDGSVWMLSNPSPGDKPHAWRPLPLLPDAPWGPPQGVQL